MGKEWLQLVNEFVKTLSRGERETKLTETINFIIKNLEKEKQLTL